MKPNDPTEIPGSTKMLALIMGLTAALFFFGGLFWLIMH